MPSQPAVFIGSSTEGLAVAETLQIAFDPVAEVVLWTQGIFDLSHSYLESLAKALDSVDFAVLVLTADDVTRSRTRQKSSPRDNVLFELGLFMGRLGRERCFYVFDATQDIKLPSDLLGIAGATYKPHQSGNLQASLGAAATAIKQRIRSVGKRPRLLRALPAEGVRDDSAPSIAGNWAGYSLDGPSPSVSDATLEIEQHGSFVYAHLVHKGSTGDRTFEYEGRLTSGQLVLFFEEPSARGYVVGTMVLHLSGDLNSLSGRSTFYHHTRKEVVSDRELFLRIRKQP
jgi:hypothetical protein